MAKNNYTVIDLFAGCGGLSLGLYQAGWHGQVSRHHRSTPPLVRVKPMAEVLGQAHALELCVVGHLDHVWVFKVGTHILRKLFSGFPYCSSRSPLTHRIAFSRISFLVI